MRDHKQAESYDSGLTIACWNVLARIRVWGLLAWRPGKPRKAALAILNDPTRSSLNPRIISLLLTAQVLTESDGTLVVTDTGIQAIEERPDVLARMRAAGVI